MPGKKWAHREKESLIRQVKQGKRLPPIRISGRSPAAAQCRSSRRGSEAKAPDVDNQRDQIAAWVRQSISVERHANRASRATG